MKFLLDQNVSPLLVGLLVDADHLVEHVRDMGMREAPDDAVLTAAKDAGAVLISSDTDFGELLARSNAAEPVGDPAASPGRSSCEPDRCIDRRKPRCGS